MRTIALIPLVVLAGCAGSPQPCHRAPADILADHRLDGLTLQAPAAEIAAQQRAWGGVCFGRALDLAVAEMLASRADLEAPLVIAGAVAPAPPCPQPDALDRLRCYLDAGGVLGLVSEAEADAELLADSWVFYLEAPALSDHVYWAEVHRQNGRVVVHGAN